MVPQRCNEGHAGSGLAWHIRRHPAYDAYPLRAGLSRPNRQYLKELWRLGLPIESAVLLSLMGAALLLVFSLSGAAVYVSRGR